jgi:hypothetical protein
MRPIHLASVCLINLADAALNVQADCGNFEALQSLLPIQQCPPAEQRLVKIPPLQTDSVTVSTCNMTEMYRICLVLFDMNNRIFEPCFVAIDRIFIFSNAKKVRLQPVGC